MRSWCSYLGILSTLFVLLSAMSSPASLGATDAGLCQNKLSYPSSSEDVCPLERIPPSLFLDPMLSSAGNVSTYSDQNHTLPSKLFVAGSTVYVKGEGWPIHVNINVSFLLGELGELSVPVVVSKNIVQTDAVGNLASSLKLAANGPPGVWEVLAEFTSDTNSSSTFVVYLPTSPPTPPNLLIPGLIGIVLGVVGLVGFLYLRRRSDRANYYSAQRRSQKPAT